MRIFKWVEFLLEYNSSEIKSSMLDGNLQEVSKEPDTGCNYYNEREVSQENRVVYRNLQEQNPPLPVVTGPTVDIVADRKTGQSLPNWNKLTSEEKKLFWDKGPIGRLIRLKAGMKYPDEYSPMLDLMIDIALYVVPAVGPMLVMIKSAMAGVYLYQEGHEVEGIIHIVTSPLALGRTIFFMRAFKIGVNYLPMLQNIHKSGLPLLASKGQEEFLKWGYKNYKKDFEIFLKVLADKEKVKSILDDVLKLKSSPKQAFQGLDNYQNLNKPLSKFQQIVKTEEKK